MFTISELLQATKGKLIRGRADISVRGISIDSRTIEPSYAFIAIKGDNFDGHDFIARAIAKGAKAIVYQSSLRGRCSPVIARSDFCDEAISKSVIASAPAALRNDGGARNDSRKVAFIEVRDTVKALGDIANFHRMRFDIPVIAVSGSSGKTTAKEMIAHVLAFKFKVLKSEGTKNNNIGLPLTLLRLTPKHEAVVLEIGTNHFGEVRNLVSIARPNMGIITNIGPAHLGHFRSLAGVYIEKATLLDCLDRPRIALLNADDLFLGSSLRGRRLPVIARRGLCDEAISRNVIASAPAALRNDVFSLGFGVRKKCDFFASKIRLKERTAEFLLNGRHRYVLSNPGMHNIYNALPAIATARLFGLGHNDIARRLSDFIFLRGRGEMIDKGGIKFIDDTYNSNPLSLSSALLTLKALKAQGRKILVMGDMLELGGSARPLHEKLGVFIADICDTLITVGDLSRLTARAALRAGLDKGKIYTSKTSVDARDILFNLVIPQKNDIILVKGSRAMHMEQVLK
ncbi:MAG: UDP-N-acetylmuramoyl-tripeptide--D-alanyl-D-alanine ligase [Candidatus Omnitrophica bacterium]|nr:UDP-N-acetylmuramoyl-tripeptide--D-alanyl-D-alanine ligase [Candidatus Omnitrophota bacterium]